MEKIDFTIVGAGIVGLNIALELKNKFPDKTIVILEKEKYLGEHSSGRNSGVLHAGIYYETGSLKHQLCLEGLYLWDDLARKYSIPILKLGKFIVARNQDETESLEKTFTQAKLNSVRGIRRASASEIKNLSENLHVTAALFSPSTGIIDNAEAINKLIQACEAREIIILKHQALLTITREKNGFHLKTPTENFQTEILINSAGLESVSLRKQLGLFDIEAYFVKGNYLTTNQKSPFKNLIYPVPPKDKLGLGVHLTLDITGKMKFGPDTEEIKEIHYLQKIDVLEKMKKQVAETFPTVSLEKLTLDYAGIRSKIYHQENLHKDFWIKSPMEGYFECLGIESPGFTASPAIARYLVKMIT